MAICQQSVHYKGYNNVSSCPSAWIITRAQGHVSTARANTPKLITDAHCVTPTQEHPKVESLFCWSPGRSSFGLRKLPYPSAQSCCEMTLCLVWCASAKHHQTGTINDAISDVSNRAGRNFQIIYRLFCSSSPLCGSQHMLSGDRT